MARRKYRTLGNVELKPWLSANPDCRERIGFAQVGQSLFLSPVFQGLTAKAQVIYLAMCVEAGQKREFYFPQKTVKRYGFAWTTFQASVKQLIEAGFVEKDISGRMEYDPTIFRFSDRWKKPP